MRYFALMLILLTLTACGGVTYAVTDEEAVEITATPAHGAMYVTIKELRPGEGIYESPPSLYSLQIGTFVRVYEYRSDGLYRVLINRWPDLGYMYIAAEFLEPHVPPKLWPLSAVEISDFGRQVAEEFLSQFDSLFVPDGVFSWDVGEDGVYFFRDGDGFYDRHGNRVRDDAPFIRGDFIASNFFLYDLNYSGIPDIVIIFVQETQALGAVYRFIDGEYTAIAHDIGGFSFFYDHYGRLVAHSPGGFQFFDSDYDDFHHGQNYCWSISFEEQGLNEIPSLTDIENAIRESIAGTAPTARAALKAGVYVTTANAHLHIEPSANAASHGIMAEGTWIWLLEYRNDEWYYVHTEDSAGYIAAEFLTPLAMPQPWPLPSVEITDFGRQVAQEFLSQFDSMFLPDGYFGRSANELAPYFSLDGDGVYDHHGNRVPDDAPFIRNFGGTMYFIATNFTLYDLNYSGIPDIVILFTLETQAHAFLYRFIDGEYTVIARDTSGFRFHYDHQGRMVAHSGVGLRYFDADGNIEDFNYAFDVDWSISFEEQGLNQIPHLADLRDAIRESVREGRP